MFCGHANERCTFKLFLYKQKNKCLKNYLKTFYFFKIILLIKYLKVKI